MKTSKQIIEDVNKVRATQKNINSFSSVQDWMKHCQETAAKKAKLFSDLETAARKEFPESYK